MSAERTDRLLQSLEGEWGNLLDGALVAGPPTLIDDGFWALRVPLPSRGLRYVISYIRATPNGLVLIDSGWDTPEGWSAILTGLEALGASMNDVSALLVTHVHPDHYGLARRVKEASGATVVLHEADADVARQAAGGLSQFLGSYRGFLSRAGVPQSELEYVNADMIEATTFSDLMEPDETVTDGQVLTHFDPTLQVIATPGHSPGHICLLDVPRKMLLSGDHLLPRVTPNVSVRPNQSANPLRDYLNSLKGSRLLETDWILPAHEWPFRDGGLRASQIIQHHQVRLAESLDLVRESPGLTGWEIALQTKWSRPFWDLEPVMRRAAVGETLAHLELLASQDIVKAVGDRTVTWVCEGTPTSMLRT